MKAFILCAGKASRLRPLTCGFPKPVLPFLNLPLLYYNWFYLERMGLGCAVLNSHLFPEMLKSAVSQARTAKQKTLFSFEPEPLGAVGGLFSVRHFFEKEARFLYMNGDSLFFPSRKELLSEFLAQGAKEHTPALFWAAPFPPSQKIHRALWIDRDGVLRAVGGPDQVRQAGFQPAAARPVSSFPRPRESRQVETGISNKSRSIKTAGREDASIRRQNFLADPERRRPHPAAKFSCGSGMDVAGALKPGELRPVRFSGLALLTKEVFHIFNGEDHSVFQPKAGAPLSEGMFKVFVDEKGLVFEGGERIGLLGAGQTCLKELFSGQDSFVRDLLLEIFRRFDPEDKKTGLRRGEVLTRKKGAPILCPESVKGTDFLQVRGFAVLGQNVSFTGKSLLHSAVLGEGVSWSGPLKKQILLKFPPPF